MALEQAAIIALVSSSWPSVPSSPFMSSVLNATLTTPGPRPTVKVGSLSSLSSYLEVGEGAFRDQHAGGAAIGILGQGRAFFLAEAVLGGLVARRRSALTIG